MTVATEIKEEAALPQESPGDGEMIVAGDSSGLSIVIPAYNEEKGIGGVLEELSAELKALELPVPLEVIIVDDGSADSTADIVEAHQDDLIRLVRHPQNRGYGAALKTGIDAATHPWILITDADGTYPNEHIRDVLAHREQNDMVVGARIGEKREIPLIRRPPKWVLRKLASFLSQQNIPDLNSGFRLMRRDEVRRFYNILPNGFSFTTTITLAMFSAGLRVKYVPINYLHREGKSHIHPIKDTINFLKLIFRTILYFDPLRVFIPASFFFLVASVAVALGSYFYLGTLMDVTTVLLFLTAVQLLALGMLADMLNRRLP
jgi:glycosyltransferase involved in cell wall biosynthesis